jgi:hypothetical protein
MNARASFLICGEEAYSDNECPAIEVHRRQRSVDSLATILE